MKPPIDAIRLTVSERDLLIRVKRKTGIDSWNILCRWALALGLRDRGKLPKKSADKRDAVEIRWDTFSGKWSETFSAAIRTALAQHTKKDGENPSVSDFIHSALERGIRVLAKQASTNELDSFCCLIKSATVEHPRLKPLGPEAASS